jgi:hypothetical protein
MNAPVISTQGDCCYLGQSRNRIMKVTDMRAEKNSQTLLVAMAVTLVVASAIPAFFIIASV